MDAKLELDIDLTILLCKEGRKMLPIIIVHLTRGVQ